MQLSLPSSERVGDSCCNTIYKCIAKIPANRLKKCLPSLISWNKSVFVEGRRIIDDILLAQEVVKDYEKLKGKARCTLEIDIMKAFKSMHWKLDVNIMKLWTIPVSTSIGLKHVYQWASLGFLCS